MWSFSNMHYKLKVNCIVSIPQLKVKSKNETFGIPKEYQNLVCIICVCILYVCVHCMYVYVYMHVFVCDSVCVCVSGVRACVRACVCVWLYVHV